jgi:hypothetical protein
MFPFLLLGGAFLAYLAFRPSTPAQPGQPTGGSPYSRQPTTATGYTGASWNVPPSTPAVDHEFQNATAALLSSYAAHGGCAGFDILSVQRFQHALNAYFLATGHPAPLPADGVYDTLTDAAIAQMTGHHYPECVLTFEAAPIVYQSAAPTPEMPQASAPAPSTFTSSLYEQNPGAISPTAGRLSYAGRT